MFPRPFAFPRLVALLGLVTVVAASAACGEDPISTVLPPEARIDTTTFAPSLGIDLDEFTVLQSGVYIKDRVVGTGDSTVKAGKRITVHYIGWLPDGTVFDQTSPDFAPAEFTVGAPNGPVAGFNAGVEGMKVGGSRLMIIPPSLGYGYAGSQNGSVPGNTIMIFRVDLYEIE